MSRNKHDDHKAQQTNQPTEQRADAHGPPAKADPMESVAHRAQKGDPPGTPPGTNLGTPIGVPAGTTTGSRPGAEYGVSPENVSGTTAEGGAAPLSNISQMGDAFEPNAPKADPGGPPKFVPGGGGGSGAAAEGPAPGNPPGVSPGTPPGADPPSKRVIDDAVAAHAEVEKSLHKDKGSQQQIAPNRIVNFVLAVEEENETGREQKRTPIVRPAMCVVALGGEEDRANFQVYVDGPNDEGHLRHGETRGTNSGVLPGTVWRSSAKYDAAGTEENTWHWPKIGGAAGGKPGLASTDDAQKRGEKSDRDAAQGIATENAARRDGSSFAREGHDDKPGK